MSAEGTKDRPGNNFSLKFIKDRIWNYDTQKACQKRLYINKTGAASVKGTLVSLSTVTDGGIILTPAGATGEESVGFVAEDGIADGDNVFVVTGGSALGLLENATASTTGNWVKNSNTVAGRIDATNGAPIPAQHWREVGHCEETNAGGTDQLIELTVHFN